MTNKRSTTLLRLDKQAQVVALNTVGFSDIAENSRTSEFGQRIKWAASLLDLNLVRNCISNNSKRYFTREEWDSFTVTGKQLFIKRGLHIRTRGHSFVISAQKCYNADMTTTLYWGGQGKTINGLNQKRLGAVYDCLTGEEDADLIIATLKDQNNNGVIGALAAETVHIYRAYTLENNGIEDESSWLLPSSGQMLLMHRYHDKIDEMMRTLWSSGNMLITDKYYWSSTTWDTNSVWAFELSTGCIANQDKNSTLLHMRAVASE